MFSKRRTILHIKMIWKEIPVVLTSLPSANLVEASFLFCKWRTFLASVQWHENDGTSSLTNTYTACRFAGAPIWPFAYLTISLPYGDKACVVEFSWFERYKWLIWHCVSHFTKQFCFTNVSKNGCKSSFAQRNWTVLNIVIVGSSYILWRSYVSTQSKEIEPESANPLESRLAF